MGYEDDNMNFVSEMTFKSVHFGMYWQVSRV